MLETEGRQTQSCNMRLSGIYSLKRVLDEKNWGCVCVDKAIVQGPRAPTLYLYDNGRNFKSLVSHKCQA